MKTSTEKISNAQLTSVTKELLSNLKERPRDILERRFGLQGHAPMVLGKIGEEFSVTRERIRQIENDSFKKLREASKGEKFGEIEKNALEVTEGAGGFCEKRLLKEKVKANVQQKQRNQLMFILNSSKKLKFKKGKLSMKGFWYLADSGKIDMDVAKSHNFIVKYIKEQKKPITFAQILDHVRADEKWKDFFAEERGQKRLKMVLGISRVVDRNILDEWGLKNWKVISQRGAREKAYIVLRKYEKPLHFRKITVLINEHWDEKEALPQTVHNELIKDGRFVLVGRGIYGLRDWGFPEGTVREVIHAFLQDQDDPVDKETIVAYVLTKKQVKRTTVMVTLADRSSFHKTNEGLFMVK